MTVGIGGVWLAVFLWQLEERPLLPSQDPEYLEGLAHAHGAGLQVVRADESPFRIWNGIGWQLRRA